MPGHVGTDIVLNMSNVHTSDPDEARRGLARLGIATEGVSDDEIPNPLEAMGESSRDNAPIAAAQAVTIILDGARAGRWRILVGDDAVVLDQAVRADPEAIYDQRGQTAEAISSIDDGEPAGAQRRTFVTWRAHSSPTSPTMRAGSATAESTNGGHRERRSVRGDQAVGPLG